MSSEGARKIVLDLAVSLDGLVEGPHGETDWCIMDAEMAFDEFLDSIDTIMYGRKSYELWGRYTPGDDASDLEREIWKSIDSKIKYVFSRSLTKIDTRSRVISQDIATEVARIKNEPGKHIWLYGGASIVSTFVNLGLVDEYRLSVHPVVLGAGKSLFDDIQSRQELELTDVRTFSSGVVQLCYRSQRNRALFDE
jgi:dihydrofolate reductase